MLKSARFLLLVVLMFALEKVVAQKATKIDSLRIELRKNESEKEKAHILNELSGYLIVNGQYAEALVHLKKAYHLALTHANHREAGISCNLLGIIRRNQSHTNEAVRLFGKAIKEFEFVKDSTQLSNAMSNMGLAFSDQSKYSKAIDFYLQAWKIRAKIGDQKGSVNSATSVGNIYFYQKSRAKALEYYLNALKISEKEGLKFESGILQNNIGMIHLQNGSIDKAEHYFKLSLRNSTALQDEPGMADAFLGLGEVSLKHENYTDAIAHASQSLVIYRKFEDRRREAEVYEQLGLSWYGLNDAQKSLEYFKKQYDLATQIGSKENQRSASKHLADYYRKYQDQAQAFKWYERYTEIRDSLLNEESLRIIAEKEAQFQHEQSKRENQLLEQKNRTLYQQNRIQELQITQNRVMLLALFGMILSLGVIAYLYFRYSRSKTEHEQLKTEQQLLRSQMNPHFIFNAMVGIQHYIYQEEPETAANYLSSVVQMMRAILEHSTRELITLETELETLEHYLKLQQVRYRNQFDYQIEIDPSIDTDLIFVPPMMTQPVIENAIEHGLLHRHEPGALVKLLVQANETDQELIICVEDNGIGRNRARELYTNTENHLSVATRITRDRIQFLNRKSKQKSRMEITDLQLPDGQAGGTRVCFYFPLNLQ